MATRSAANFKKFDLDSHNTNKEININLTFTLQIKLQKGLFSVNNGHFLSTFVRFDPTSCFDPTPCLNEILTRYASS